MTPKMDDRKMKAWGTGRRKNQIIKKRGAKKILHCRNVSVVFENSAIYYNPTVIEYHG